MKKIAVLIITFFSAIYMSGCASEQNASAVNDVSLTQSQIISADSELASVVKNAVVLSDFWYSFYSGKFYFPTEDIELSNENRLFRSFKIIYNDISSECPVEFDNIEKIYSGGICYANMPFSTISEIKKEIEKVYTYDCATVNLYDIYDEDYLENNGMLLRCFSRDTIYYSADYDSLKIISANENEIKAEILIYYAASDEPVSKAYTLNLDDGIWKISHTAYI